MGLGNRYDPLVSNGDLIFGIHEDVSTPPDIYEFDPKTNHLKFITKLNPELDDVALAPAEKIAWQTASGNTVEGYLWKPIDYVAGQRYPLVIQTKGNSGRFQCDSGANHAPAFEPQPMASAGIMYLTQAYAEGYDQAAEKKEYPRQYPGQLGEVGYYMGLWEGAVDSLVSKGLVDPNKVGIIGFSHTGWHVEFFLAHSTVHYAAATASDSIQYSLGEYWATRDPATVAEFDQMYGGPPYGASLKNWLDYSVSFNLDKFHTPLLIETMGYGDHDKRNINLLYPSEIFTALNRLGNPVEWYYYPDEEHELDDPRARLASLQRNLDWYRFWLQDFEDPTPTKKEQYDRWRHLRELRDVDNAK
jgi:dipeptidyl aminopeptidase/acylaminoacyl peptidase